MGDSGRAGASCERLNRVNILTHPVHTGYQFDLAQTGNEFYSLDTPGGGERFWDGSSRPQPPNYHRLRVLDDAPVNFDLILVHNKRGYDLLKHLNLPLIFKEHCLRDPFRPASDWIDRISFYSFASQAAAARWILPDESADRKVIIGMGFDPHRYRHGGRERNGILTVGQNIRSRGSEKGYADLMRLAQRFDITVVGRGNEGIPGSVGPARSLKALLGYYRSHEIFINPSNILGMSTLEAMAMGMAVVSFRTINSDIIQDGVNGILADTVEEAAAALRTLLGDKPRALRLGAAACRVIRERFSAELFRGRWNALFRLAAYEYCAGFEPKSWRPFDLDAKPEAERALAARLVGGAFEYRRVGYDERRMTFLQSGWIGEGRGGCETFWDVKIQGGRAMLELSSAKSLTCRLRRRPDGSWRGRWLRHEKMPIVLAPVSGP